MSGRGTLKPGDVLVTDNEASWTTDEVEYYLETNDITHLTYPTYLGSKLDPCDNSFHASASFPSVITSHFLKKATWIFGEELCS